MKKVFWNKRALLLNNSQKMMSVKPSSLTTNVMKLTGSWILLRNVGKATFQCLMIKNSSFPCIRERCCPFCWTVGGSGVRGFSVLEPYNDDPQ